ncbi:MAG: hypothetical protein R3E45_11840 [Rhodocyclaceae bacterium]
MNKLALRTANRILQNLRVTAKSTNPPAARSPKASFASRLFGYDVFISFALGGPPRGSQSYASDLARRLRDADLSVFFSEDEGAARRTAVGHAEARVAALEAACSDRQSRHAGSAKLGAHRGRDLSFELPGAAGDSRLP